MANSFFDVGIIKPWFHLVFMLAESNYTYKKKLKLHNTGAISAE